MPAVVWTFEGDTRDLEAALNQVQGSVNETNKDLQQTGKEGQKGFKLTEEGAKKAAKVIGGTLVAGLAAATAATVALAASAVNVAKNLNSLAKQGRRVGALASEIDTLNGAFGLLTENGVDSARVLEDVNRNLGLAASGSKDVQRAFGSLGLPDDFSGRDAISRVSLLVERIGAIKDPAERADVASKTLGRSWRELQTVFASGEGALDTAIQQVREAGVVSDEAAAQSEALLDAIDLSTRAWQSLSREALEPLIPILTDVFEELGELLDGLDPAAVDAFANRLSRLVGTLADVSAGAIKAATSFLGLAAAQGDEGAKSAQAAIVAQAEQIDQLKEQIRVSKEVDSVTGGLSDETRKLTAELEKEIAVLGRLRGEIGAIAGLGGGPPSAGGSSAPASSPRGGGGGGGGGAPAPAAAGGLGTFDMNSAYLEAVESANEYVANLQKANLKIIEDAERRKEETTRIAQEEAAALKSVSQDLAKEIGAAVTQATEMVLSAIMTEYETTKSEVESIEDAITKTTDEGTKARLLVRKEAKEKELEEEKKAAIAAFALQKVAAIAEAAVSMALGIANSLSMGMPQGAIFAAISAVASGAAIAAIAAQPPPAFHSGGVLRASDIKGANMDSVMIRAKPGEGILSTAGVAAVGGADGVDDLNAGRTRRGGTTVNVIRFGTRTTEAISHQQLQSRTGKMQGAFRSVRPKVGRSIPGRR